jgi:hypothetical protein
MARGRWSKKLFISIQSNKYAIFITYFMLLSKMNAIVFPIHYLEFITMIIFKILIQKFFKTVLLLPDPHCLIEKEFGHLKN